MKQLYSVCLIVCLVLASSHQLVDAAMKEFQCHHKAPTGPARYVHLDESTSYQHHPSGHISTRSLGAFRIFVYYDSSVNQLSATVRTRLMRVVSNLVEFYESALQVRQVQSPIVFDRDCQNGAFYIFQQPPVRRCQFACATTMCGEVRIPDQHLKACTQCFGSSRSCRTTGSDGPGVTGTDFVLYVSAIETGTCGGSAGSTIAYASHCHQEDTLDRPIAGHANFCPNKIESPDADDTFILAVAKHEVLHALAFSTGLYAFWRDVNGNPRTPRDSNGQPPRTTSGYVASSSTLRTKTSQWQTRNGPVDHTVTMLVTPAIVAEGRRHFNCPTLDGVEVENQGGPGTALSHWEKRVLDNEGMTGVISPNPVFSSFTFALLEDSGWYTVDYSKAQLLVWGWGSGCDLPTGSCGGYIQNRQFSGQSISPFCNRLRNVSPQTRSCTLDRTAISQCSLTQYTTSLPPEYQYFNFGENFGGSTGLNIDTSAVGGNQLPDFCPSHSGFSNGNCSDIAQQRSGTDNGFAETYASGSRCVEHAGPWSAGGFRYSPYGSGCYQYRCSAGGKVTLYVLGQAYPCNEDGDTISVDVTRSGVRYQGSLICPACIDICYDDFNSCPAARTKYGGFNKPVLASDPGNAGPRLTSPVLLVLFLLAITVLAAC